MRHAIYFAPPAGHVLHRLGSAWLGRDSLAAADCPRPDLPGIAAADHAALTASARRYGLHATLKPPFALAPGRREAELAAAVAALAARLSPVALRLRLGRIDGFFALLPVHPSPALSDLAAACVAELDRFRAVPDAAELARRRAGGLSAAQEAMLLRWGYPYVMDAFRFHITLTDRVGAARAEALSAALQRHFAPALAQPLVLDALSLFLEPEPGAAFDCIARFPLGATRADPPRNPIHVPDTCHG